MTVYPMHLNKLRCARCGQLWQSIRCGHPSENLRTTSMTDDEAERVQARYALSKYTNNPDHDTTSFRDPE